MPFEHLHGSEDPDAVLYRQLEQHVLDHYPNPTRKDCLNSETLKSIVYEPQTLNLQDSKYGHVMACAECMREVIAFRQARQAQIAKQPPVLAKKPNNLNLLVLGATAAACLLIGLTIGTHRSRVTPPSSREVHAEVLDLSGEPTARGVEPIHPRLLMKEAGLVIVELPPLSPQGRYEVTLQQNDGKTLVSATGTANTQDGKLELRLSWSLAALPSGTYRLSLKSEQDSAPYFYPVQLH